VRQQRGFTLIEMLVAMAIFTALISVLMLGYRQGLLLWDKSQRQSHQWLDTEFRYSLLDTLISQAILSDNQYEKGLYATYFIGTSSSIKLMSAAPIMDITGHIRPIEIKATKENNTWQLRYREGARHSDYDRGITWSEDWVSLFSDLDNVAITYLAPPFPLPEELDIKWLSDKEKLLYRDKATWVSSYNSQQRWLFPLQIAIEFGDKNGKHKWLFTPPNSPTAWTMEAYEDE